MIDSSKWVVYKDYDRVPPIIDEDIWNKVNDIIRDREIRCKCNYQVFCIKHGNVNVKRKKYKEKIYFYFRCDCFRISSNLLDRIDRVNKIDKVYIEVNKELILKVKCQY